MRLPTRADYFSWRDGRVVVDDQPLLVASRPGVFADGATDPAALLLARHVVVPPGASVVHFGSGNGLVLAASRHAAGTVVLTDRHAANAAASARTIALNAVSMARAWHAHGAPADGDGVTAPAIADGSVDVVTIRIPPEKAALAELLRDAHRILRPDGRCWVAGGTHEGIKPAVALLDRWIGPAVTAAVGSGHRVAVATRGALAPEPRDAAGGPLEYTVTVRGHTVPVCTRPGVFSREHLDAATALLAETMRVRPGARVLDLGCGSGVLGVVASRLAGVPAVFVDADSEAVRATRATVARAGLSGALVLASDVTEALPEDARFDLVVTNPPFHHGKATTFDVPRAFITQAHAVLATGGWLELVANRTLPYEAIVREVFGECVALVERGGFKVLAAQRRR